MARSSRKKTPRRPELGNPVVPVQHGHIQIELPANTVEVRYHNPDSDMVEVSIAPFVPPGSGPAGAAFSMPVTLQQQGSSQTYFAHVPAGAATETTPSGADNRWIVWNNIDEGSQASYPFRVYNAGSGAQILVQTLHRCPNCGDDRPVPVALQLTLETPLQAGSCDCNRLNRPTQLVHAQDAGYSCRWLSPPIDLGARRDALAAWVLEKADAVTWELVLRRGEKGIAIYRLGTASKQCSFPIRLKFIDGGNECKNWPPYVTVDGAP